MKGVGLPFEGQVWFSGAPKTTRLPPWSEVKFSRGSTGISVHPLENLLKKRSDLPLDLTPAWRGGLNFLPAGVSKLPRPIIAEGQILIIPTALEAVGGGPLPARSHTGAEGGGGTWFEAGAATSRSCGD